MLRPSPLADQAARHLRDQIASGRWPVGTRLPGETALAGELGVGRSTVREAIRALAGAGMLRSRQGAGVFVVATEPAGDWAARLRRASVAQVYEVRQMIETRAAELAAERRTDKDLAALDLALAAREAAAGELLRDPAPGSGPAGAAGVERFVDADIAVHRAVVAAAHNPILADLFAEFLPVLREGLLDLLRLVDVREHHGRESHAALVEAVRARDAGAASRVVAAELSRTLAHLEAL